MLYEAGIVRAVALACRVDVRADDELLGEMGLWLCEAVLEFDGRGDLRGFAFDRLRRKAIGYRRKHTRRAQLLGTRVDEKTIPQLRYCPDTHLFQDDPEAIRIMLDARIAPPTNYSRKAYEIRRERLRRLKVQHAP